MLRLDIEPPAEVSPSKSTMAAPSSAKPVYIEHPILTLERLEWQDERSKLRLQVALWASITTHLILLILGFIFWPKIQAWQEAREAAQAREISPQQALKDRELTFLELPPAPVVQPKDSSIISDQNRSATVKQPQLDRKRLKEILDSTQRETRRAGNEHACAAKVHSRAAERSPATASQDQPQPHQPANQLAHLESPPHSESLCQPWRVQQQSLRRLCYRAGRERAHAIPAPAAITVRRSWILAAACRATWKSSATPWALTSVDTSRAWCTMSA